MNLERSLLRVMLWPVHRALFRLSGGRMGTQEATAKRIGTLFLTTTGRKSGEKRTTPVFFIRDGQSLVVVASNVGDDRDPAWYLNLRANPDGAVEVAPAGVTSVQARDATDEERARLWPELVRLNPSYERYVGRTSRPLPVVILEPA